MLGGNACVVVPSYRFKVLLMEQSILALEEILISTCWKPRVITFHFIGKTQ